MSPLVLTKLIEEKKLAARISELAKQITKDYAGKDVIMVSVLKGSFVFFADLIRQVELDIKTEFLGCSSYGNATRSSGEVKLTLDLTSAIEGKHVILVEDIVDTGLTMEFLMQTLAARKPASMTACTLLFKPEAMKTKTKLAYVGFEIGTEFVVGYGLDYQGYYRNLPYIAQVNNIN